MEHTEYEAQARRFLETNNLTIKTAFKGDKCPHWDNSKHIHGDRYRVTIKRIYNIWNGQPHSISFDFWNSLHDKESGNKPTAYDVLACISSDAYMPTNPDEVVAELGEMKPSQAIATANFAKKLQSFFTKEELEQLSKIQ